MLGPFTLASAAQAMPADAMIVAVNRSIFLFMSSFVDVSLLPHNSIRFRTKLEPIARHSKIRVGPDASEGGRCFTGQSEGAYCLH